MSLSSFLFFVSLNRISRLKDLSVSFARKFPTVSPLPTLLSALSSAQRPFSTLIPTHDHRPLFTDVLIWLLKRDLVQMLHVRVRLSVSREIKKSVREKRKREREERKRDREVKEARRQEGKAKGKAAPRMEKRRSDAGLGGYTYPSLRPGESPSTSRESSRDAAITSKKKNPLKKRGRHSLDNAPTVSRSYDPRGKSIGLDGYNSDEESGGDGGYDADVREALAKRRDREREEWGEADEDVTPSFITEPGRATKLERKWMEVMMGQVGRMDDRSNYWFERCVSTLCLLRSITHLFLTG